MCSLPVGPNECPLLAESRRLAAAVFPVLTTPVVVRVPAAWSEGRDAVPRRVSGGDNRSGDYQPFAICRNRKGLSTVGAITAAMMFRTAAITKTAVQLPVADINTLPSGTSSAAVPLAVYNKP